MVGLVATDMGICPTPGAGPHSLRTKYICIAWLVAVHTHLHRAIICVILQAHHSTSITLRIRLGNLHK